MISYTTATSVEELQQILDLQERNLPTIIPTVEKSTEGFVTVHHTMDILTKLNKPFPHTIAKVEGKVVGYALSMHPKFENEIEILRPMFAQIHSALKQYNTSKALPINSFMVLGQICIDKDYRRRGIFRNLYKQMQQLIAPEFDIIVTGVNSINRRSLEAHYAVGFKTLYKYHSEGEDWELVFLR